MNTILIIIAGLCLVGYLLKRRSRLKSEDCRTCRDGGGRRSGPSCGRCHLWSTLAGCAMYNAPASSPFIVKKGSGPVDAGRGVKTPKGRPRGDRACQRATRSAERAARSPSRRRRSSGWIPMLRDALAALEREASATRPRGRRPAVPGGCEIYDAAYDQFSDAIRLDGKNVAAWDGRARVWRDGICPVRRSSDVYRARFYRPGPSGGPQHARDDPGAGGPVRRGAGRLRVGAEADPAAAWARDNLVRLEGRADTCGGP